jgi:hypothetical protein
MGAGGRAARSACRGNADAAQPSSAASGRSATAMEERQHHRGGVRMARGACAHGWRGAAAREEGRC